ncbi:hypothetical protein X975_25192, partial [Stegodyphus mimosarum]
MRGNHTFEKDQNMRRFCFSHAADCSLQNSKMNSNHNSFTSHRSEYRIVFLSACPNIDIHLHMEGTSLLIAYEESEAMEDI